MKTKIILFTILGLSCAALAQTPLANNTIYGTGALGSNTTGKNNSAIGNLALGKNTTGNSNTAVGSLSLYSATTASSNVAIGRWASYYNTTGGSNTAIGYKALYNNKNGLSNVAVGLEAMVNNVGGYFNTAVGNSAGPAFGSPDLYNATAIGYFAQNTANTQVRIGNEFVTNIGGHVSWSTLSDGRFKKDVQEDIAGLDFINKLRPVSYTIDEDALSNALRTPDSVRSQLRAARKSIPRHTGFVAQEVEAVIKKGKYAFDGVNAPQNDGDQYSIRYAEFVVPLVKAVQELTSIVNEQQRVSDEQSEEIASLKEKLGAFEDKSPMNSATNTGAELFQNSPNPFNSDTEIRMNIPESSRQAHLNLYNLEGRQLKSVQVDGRGQTSTKIAGSEISAGIYLYALIVDGKLVDSKRLIVTK